MVLLSDAMQNHCTLHISNLDPCVTSEMLKDKCSAYGKVVRSYVSYMRNGRSRGFGFVSFADKNALKAALVGLKGRLFGNRRVTVEKAKPRSCEPVRKRSRRRMKQPSNGPHFYPAMPLRPVHGFFGYQPCFTYPLFQQRPFHPFYHSQRQRGPPPHMRNPHRMEPGLCATNIQQGQGHPRAMCPTMSQHDDSWYHKKGLMECVNHIFMGKIRCMSVWGPMGLISAA